MLKKLSQSSLLWWSLICLGIFFCYAPGWNGPFVFDDQLNITENPNVPIHSLNEREILQSALSNESGPLKRIIPALSFGLNYYFADGFKSVHFKLTNIAVHCINSALVFWLLTLLWPCISARAWVKNSNLSQPALTFAVSGTLIWALHAFLLTSVLYIVQRMTSMGSLFMLMGICLYVVGRLSLDAKPAKGLFLMCLGLIAGTVLGLACKENAILLPVYIAVLEFTLLSSINNSQQALIKIRWFFVIFLGLPLLVGLVYWLQHPTFITGGYGSRSFTLLERVLTEPRVLWFYLSMIVLPNIQTMGLFHDDFPLSSDLFSIWTTLPSIIGIVILLILALAWRKRFPIFSFAVLWFLVGHSLESTIVPLEIIHEHRNYLAALGPLVAISYLLAFSLANKIPQAFRISLIGLVVFCLGFATFNRAQYWSSESALIESLAMNHPDSPSSQYLRGEVLRKREKNFDASYAYYLRAAELAPQEVGFLISLSMVSPKTFYTTDTSLQTLQLANPLYIARMVNEKPVSAWGIRALDVAIKCTLSNNRRCLSKADDVASWLQALANKPSGKAAHRYYAVVYLFAIRMKQGRFNDALLAAQLGLNHKPNHPRFKLMQAHALIGLKQLDKARLLINNVERSGAAQLYKYQQMIVQLKKALAFVHKNAR